MADNVAAPRAMKGPPPPARWPHTTADDVRAAFAATTSKSPVDVDLRAAFLRSKLLVAKTHPTADLAARERAVQSLAASIGPMGKALAAQPTPGGVGYGTFYNQAFKDLWGSGTSWSSDFVCPSPPGGNLDTWLYITGMNRAGLGVEAFVSYNGQGTPHFQIFDWARAEHWQTDIPFVSLSNYLTTTSRHGHPYPTLPVWNGTWLLEPGKYRNQALLYNHVRGGWDLIYQYDYPGAESQQKGTTVWVGSWAAIVETFQSAYDHTQPMGALDVQLVSADNSGNWGNWALLAASNSYVRTDNVGFLLVSLDPNCDFIVDS